MISINEIRVGNLLKSYYNIVEVYGIGKDRTDLILRRPNTGVDWCMLYQDLSGIKLDEEILLKVGFGRTKVPMKSDIEYIDYRMGQFVLFILPKGIVEVEFCAAHSTIEERGYLREIKYLHQLQNLIFILTGQELNTSGLIK